MTQPEEKPEITAEQTGHINAMYNYFTQAIQSYIHAIMQFPDDTNILELSPEQRQKLAMIMSCASSALYQTLAMHVAVIRTSGFIVTDQELTTAFRTMIAQLIPLHMEEVEKNFERLSGSAQQESNPST